MSGQGLRTRPPRLTALAAVTRGVEHEAVVKVNEEGTEAAAATGAEIPGSAPMVELNADQPFLFFVRDRHTGSILFMGPRRRSTRRVATTVLFTGATGT